MGTFLGHILPGTFFFIYGLLYTVRDAFTSTLKTNKPRASSSGLNSSADPDRRESPSKNTSLGSLENGFRSTNGWQSFDFESDAEEETQLYSRSEADDDFPLNSESREQNRGAATVRGLPTVTHKCGRCRDYFTNISIIEGTLKIVCALVGALGELWWGGWYIISPRDGGYTNMNNWQHATMFAFFAVSGIADIAYQTCLKTSTSLSSSRSNGEKIFLSLAFWIEGLLFFFHTHGRSELDVHIHTMLVIAIFLCAAGSGLELWCYRPGNLNVRHLWVAATCLQGTWFWQIAFVLYNPWKDDSKDEIVDEEQQMHTIMMMTTMFAWHILAVLLITVLTHLVIRYCSKFRCCKN